MAGGAYMPIRAAGTPRHTPGAGVSGRPMKPFLFFFFIYYILFFVFQNLNIFKSK
jgi:hypothetical protein